MTQVTMTGEEYVALVEKVKAAEALMEQIHEAVEVDTSENSSYRPVWTTIRRHLLPDEINFDAAYSLANVAATNTKVMDHLFSNNSHFYDKAEGYVVDEGWSRDRRTDPAYVDLLDVKEFKDAWDAAERRSNGKFDCIHCGGVGTVIQAEDSEDFVCTECGVIAEKEEEAKDE